MKEKVEEVSYDHKIIKIAHGETCRRCRATNIDRPTSKCGKSGRFGNRALGLDPAKTSAYVELE